jgi:hypothetical protein
MEIRPVGRVCLALRKQLGEGEDGHGYIAFPNVDGTGTGD